MASLDDFTASVGVETEMRSRSPEPLFKPYSLKSLNLKNRIVMAPMTRYFSPTGAPGDDVARYYRRRAEGGCGLIITEGTTIETRDAGGYKAVPHFWGRAALEGWRRVADEVHAGGAKIIPQLWHVGLQRDPAICPDPELVGVGPSGLNRQLEVVRDPATPAEIQEVVDAFARGAAAAIETGFDGVQLHGAHGYLIDQFLWARTNLREDEFGGSIERRARFAVQVVEAVRREVGPDFPLLLRISQWKGHDYAAKLEDTPERLKALLAPIASAGVDMFDCSQRRFWEPEYAGSSLNLAGWVKKLTGIPTITVGSVSLDSDFIGGMLRAETAGTGDLGRIDELVDRLAQEEFDLVAVGRALLSDPGWPEKIRAGRYEELRPFDPAILGSLE